MKIGEILKQARVEKGLTLSQAAKDLFVQEKYLRALEEGNYEVIPGEAYQRAYFRSYAEYLGLSQYIEDLTRPYRFSSETEEQPVEDILGGPWDAARVTRVTVKLGLIVLVIVALFVLPKMLRGHPKERVQPNRVNSTQPLTVVPLGSEPSWQAPDQGASPSGRQAEPVSGTHEIKLTAKGQCWVVVKVRSGKLLERMMTAGQTVTFQDLVGFYLSAGMPENLDVVFDGHSVRWETGQTVMILPPGAAVIPETEPPATTGSPGAESPSPTN
jgi:cytoskeletal protein RodZ